MLANTSDIYIFKVGWSSGKGEKWGSLHHSSDSVCGVSVQSEVGYIKDKGECLIIQGGNGAAAGMQKGGQINGSVELEILCLIMNLK